MNDPKSSQNFSINVEAARLAVTEFEWALQATSLPAETLAELSGDLDTIKAQIAKPSPSRTIINEAGSSIRNVIEGMSGGMLPNSLGPYASDLLDALGLN